MSLFETKDHPIRSNEAAKIIEWVAAHLKNVSDYKDRIAKISSIMPLAERERLFLNLYLEAEKEVCRDVPKVCPSPRIFRENIYAKFGLKNVTPSLFTVPFFPEPRQILFLYRTAVEKFLAQLHFGSKELLAIALPSAVSQQFQAIKGGWDAIEKAYRALPAEQQEVARVADFKYLIARLYQELVRRVGEERGRIGANNIFRDLARTFRFLGSLSSLLPLLPTGVLEEDRILFYSRERLTEELQRRMRELEATNVSLAEEARKLRAAVVDLEQAQQQMVSMQHAQDEFIRIVSHQFRTPLSVIRWESEVVAEDVEKHVPDAISSKTLDQIHAVNRKAVFLADVLNRVFDLLALESGTFKLNPRPTPLWEIIEDVRRGRQHEASLDGVSLAFDKSGALPVEILVDPDVIRKILDIFLANAIQYSSRGSAVIIRLILEEGKGFRIEVQDRGIGVPKELQEKIFEKFYRAERAVRTAPDGAGISLYVAKKLMELHGGQIGVTSEGAGKGSIFWLMVPQQVATPQS